MSDSTDPQRPIWGNDDNDQEKWSHYRELYRKNEKVELQREKARNRSMVPVPWAGILLRSFFLVAVICMLSYATYYLIEELILNH